MVGGICCVYARYAITNKGSRYYAWLKEQQSEQGKPRHSFEWNSSFRNNNEKIIVEIFTLSVTITTKIYTTNNVV